MSDTPSKDHPPETPARHPYGEATTEPTTERTGGHRHAPDGATHGRRGSLRIATRARVAAAVLLSLLLIALLAAGIFGGPSDQGWSTTVSPIATEVAQLRGLSFDHTVPVHFLSSSRFAARIRSMDQPQTSADRADQRRYASEVRSLGLVDGTVDLTSAQSNSDSADTDGEYDERTRQVLIRGRSLGVAEKVTLAHELTHVLQDQHFDLTRLSDHASTSGASAALTALEEGDAVRIEDDLLAGLSGTEQQAYARIPQGGAGAPPGDVAPIVEVTSAVPYVLGPDMVDAIAARGGNSSVDMAFRSPPTAEISFLEPTTYLEHMGVENVATPALRRGDRPDGSADDFGAFSLYLTLASRIDPLEALAVADGWGGDRQLQFFRGIQSCVMADFVGQNATATARIGAALSSWQETMPVGQASVAALGHRVELTACDPGTAGRAGPRSLSAALDLVDARNANLAAALSGGASNAIALCDGNGAIRDQALLDAERSANSSVGQPSEAVTRTIEQETHKIDDSCIASSRSG